MDCHFSRWWIFISTSRIEVKYSSSLSRSLPVSPLLRLLASYWSKLISGQNFVEDLLIAIIWVSLNSFWAYGGRHTPCP